MPDKAVLGPTANINTISSPLIPGVNHCHTSVNHHNSLANYMLSTNLEQACHVRLSYDVVYEATVRLGDQSRRHMTLEGLPGYMETTLGVALMTLERQYTRVVGAHPGYFRYGGHICPSPQSAVVLVMR